MSKIKQYKSAAAFRIGLEKRLQNKSDAESIDIMRLRKKVAFDRFLLRFSSIGAVCVLKGGYGMELRFKNARATKDIDIAIDMKRNTNNILDILRQHAQNDLNDHFNFVVGAATTELENLPYGGKRFPVQAMVAGRIFIQFHIDAAIGNYSSENMEKIKSEDWLGFAGIKPGEVLLISVEQQFAEKIHALTLPRNQPNSRVKDLIDIYLLIKEDNFSMSKALDCLKNTFRIRKTHEIPKKLYQPQNDWDLIFESLAKDCGMDGNIENVMYTVNSFWKSMRVLN